MNQCNLLLARSMRTAVEPTENVCRVAAMFGLGVDEHRTIEVVAPTQVVLRPGQVVFITGASGGGKTTLLRLINERLADQPDVTVIDFAATESSERSLVDSLGGELEQSMRWLSLAGLNDAFVMLRTPDQLSDGQRYRFRLAQAMAQAERGSAARLHVVLADEFAATLDRLTAAVVARNVRKWINRCSAGVCFVAATTHDDLLEPLDPDVLIVQHAGEKLELHTRDDKRNR